MNDQAVKWKDPPEPGEGRDSSGRFTSGVWEDLLTPLKKRPKKWAHIRTMKVRSAMTTVWRLRYDIELVKPSGLWEFRTAVNGDLADIYARYLGPEK